MSQQAALELARKETPLRQVTAIAGTPPGPTKWVLYGTDESGRKLAVWVSQRMEGFVYLDTGISAEEAVTRATATGARVDPNATPVLVGPTSPYWYLQGVDATGNHFAIRVSFTTGEVSAIR